MRVHDESTAIKLWKCDSCSSRFTKKEQLIVHYKHEHPDLKLPECLSKSSNFKKTEVIDLTIDEEEEEEEEDHEEEDSYKEESSTVTKLEEEHRDNIHYTSGDANGDDLGLNFCVTSAVRTSFKKDLKEGKITSILDMITGNLPEKRLGCKYTNCHRTFRRQYDLDRHLKWHAALDVKLDRRLAELNAENQNQNHLNREL
ncbi:unnamed protein product [Ambrosiozyma monospora]|uniref:Unnamed protein product n=1 Tax=Ambrosiozyma monospora TaxID=43982 RepID=A0A9W6Z568_AMBMO|nr:unnamed protein product [Ambrosiozyma monospora]